MIEKGKQAVGKKGEELAAEYLKRLGQVIVERNWRISHLEVDIITSDSRGLHFVEVKTLVAPNIVPPEFRVNSNKRGKITSAARKYIALNPQDGREVFFDIVSVILDGLESRIEYFPQAWIPVYV